MEITAEDLRQTNLGTRATTSQEDPDLTRIVPRTPSPEVAMLQLTNIVAAISLVVPPCLSKRNTTYLQVSFQDSEEE